MIERDHHQRLLATEDLEDLRLPLGVASGRTFVGDERSLSLRLYRSRGRIVGVVRFGDACAGPPGHAHGGVSSYVLDEAMAAAVFARGYAAAAMSLCFDLIRMTPLGTDLRVEANIVTLVDGIDPDRPAGATVGVESRLVSPDGKLLVSGTGSFRVLATRTWKSLLASADGRLR